MHRILSAYWPGLVILLVATVTGLIIYPDYGITYDEACQHMIGETYYKYVTGQYPDIQQFSEKDHGPGFEWILLFFENILDISDFRQIYLMRRLVSFLFYVCCMSTGYVLTLKMFKNKWLASFALIALIFHPRLFAHSFFNPKDIPAAGLIMVTLAASYYAFSKRKALPYVILGIVCAYGICIRITNMVVLAPILLLLLADVLRTLKSKEDTLKSIKHSVAFIAALCGTLYLSWPTLWGAPISNFLEAWHSNANFRWVDHMLFNGHQTLSTELPWYYIPMWVSITTPIVWLASGIAGILLFIIQFIKRPVQLLTPQGKILFIAFTCSTLPVVMVIALKSVLYDGWRHLYIIYPAFIVLATYAIHRALQTKLRYIAFSAIALQIVFVGWFIAKKHPFQQVYFNAAVSHQPGSLIHNYELDYWGSSTLHAMLWLNEHVKDDDEIVINNSNFPLIANYNFLPEDIKHRFKKSADWNEIEYSIEFFRTKPYPAITEGSGNSIIHEEIVLGSPVYRIVKQR